MEKEKILNEISKVIVYNRRELVDKLDELELACSCTIFDASDKDLSDIVIESLDKSAEFREWIAGQIYSKSKYFNAGADPITAIANAIGEFYKTMGKGLDVFKSKQEKQRLKEEWKKELTLKAIEARMQHEKEKSKNRTKDVLLISGAALLLLGVGFAIYYSNTRQQSQKAAA